MIDAREVRRIILDIAINSKEGHIASSFSIVEMLISIVEDMNQCSGNVIEDCMVLSKGHASYAYYALLNQLGLMSKDEIFSIGNIGSKFYGHLPHIVKDRRFTYGSGSLGHGMPYALGLSVAKAMYKKDQWVYCIIGDGEANEGTFWETLLLCSKFSDSKLKVLVDCNRSSERAIPIFETLKKINNAFQGVSITMCDGHNVDNILESLSVGENIRIVLCETIKGYPSKIMENNPVWHHRTPSSVEADFIRRDLK